MHIEEIIQKIVPADAQCAQLAQARFDALIKPVGSLAQLEKMTAKYAGIVKEYNKQDLDYPKRELLVWCDIAHAEEAGQIMEAKLPMNVLAAETNARTQALLVTAETEADAMEEGAALVQEIVRENGLGLVGFGCLSGAGEALDKMVLAAMTGGILQAAAMRVGVMLDGVATLQAAQKARELVPSVLDYCFAGHVSAEEGAEALLAALGLVAPLRLNIPEGAGEGAAICFTLLDAGIKSYKEMETFEEASVHAEVKEFSLAEQEKKAK